MTQKPQPASKARRIIGPEVVGGAEARPKGFGNLKIMVQDYMLCKCSRDKISEWKSQGMKTVQGI